MADPPDLKDRLDRFEARRKPRRRARPGLGMLALAVSLGGALLAYLFASGFEASKDRLGTSDVETFQDSRRPAADRLAFPAEKEPADVVDDAVIRVEEALEAPAPPAPVPTTPDTAVLDELKSLREALSASQSARDAEIQAAVTQLREAFASQVKALQSEISARQAALDAQQRESGSRIAGLESMLAAEREQREALEAELNGAGRQADQDRLEEQRRLDEEEQQREADLAAEELLKAQIRAPAVVYAGGKGTGASSGSTVALADGAPPLALDADEDYLTRAARPLKVDEAARMEFPDRTLAQGSVIQAALQTAISSDLPGSVVAVVTEPVEAFAGSQILIPKGSKLFGQYRSGIALHQRRILIVWTRILTPDGTSLELAAPGGDALGRSGLSGDLDTRFLQRFGGAALISMIGAAPSIAANNSSDEVVADALENVGTDLEDAVGSVIADQVSIAPTIYVDQGALVTVIVDRDIILW